MRIISQDGTIDIPYDYFSLSISPSMVISGKYEDKVEASIYCHNLSSPKGTKLAEYSTMKKAEKAMEMLRTAYTGRFVTNADVPDDFNEQLKELMKGGFGTVIIKDTNDSRVEFYNLNGYFQFPQDEDVSGSGTKRSKSFGEKVLNILKYKGISQRELAEKVGCTEVSMSRYISGERVPKAPIVVKIADVLGVTVEYLVSDSIE